MRLALVRRLKFVACSFAMAVALSLSAACAAADVEVFSPQGEVKGVRQIAVRFSEPMIAFGDPAQASPFDIQCPEKGSARWADQKNWVFDFDRDLPAGVRCSFVVKADLKTIDGHPVETKTFSFTTGGPAILESLPYRGDTIDEEQIFILGLDAPADPRSVVEHAYCDARGITEKIPVKLITGEERLALLAERRDFVGRFLLALYKDGKVAAIAERDLLRGTRAEQLAQADETKLPALMLRCARRLPNDVPLRLVWGAGIESISGVATAQPETLDFKVRPVFTANFSCDRVNRDANCLPFLPMRLSFSAPIARSAAEKIALRSADGRPFSAKLPDAQDDGASVQEVSFNGPFPEQATFKLEIPADLRDDAGRKLANHKRFPLVVKTDVAPPLAKFPAQFGIIELKADPTLPVTLRNVEPVVAGKQVSDMSTMPGAVLRVGAANARTIVDWMRRVDQSQRVDYERVEEGQPGVASYAAAESIFGNKEKTRAIKVPKPNGARAFEVVGIPLHTAGFYVVELVSPKLGEALLTDSRRDKQKGAKPAAKLEYHVSTAALVTNLAVHFKQGRESSLVWVTALDSGAPVAGAKVSIQDCDGREHWKGVTDVRGIARVSKTLPMRDTLPDCLQSYDKQYMVFAATRDDTSFVLSNWNEGISHWRFNLPGAEYDGPFIATTVFDRTLVRAGETVHMKHLYRQHTRAGFRFVANSALPATATIEHVGSDQKYDVALKWDAKNSAESTWAVPKDAKTGAYRVIMQDTLDEGRGSRGHARVTGTFRVEEFRVPLMRASIEPPSKALVNADSAELSVQVSYLAGGGATGLPVKLRGVVQPRTVNFPGFDDFTFSNGPVKEGVQDDRRNAWYRGDYAMADGDDDAGVDPNLTSGQTRPLKSVAFNLDAAGGGKPVLTSIPLQDTPQEVVAELEYSDPNGEILTASSRVPLWPADVAVGIKADSWALTKDTLKFQIVVLDLTGKPVPNAAVTLDLFQRKTFSHRKRLLGGFYAYQSGREVVRLKTVCEARSDDKGRVFCEFASPVSGEVVVQANVHDAQGRLAAVNTSVWVAGSGDWWFEVSNDDRMDLLPEKKRYEPGEEAVFQVRMPFRKATALVSVEREGVMDVFVTELSGKAPVVKVPIRGWYAPNIFVSVLAVRGRVGDVQPTALVDLGKPAFKMGMAEINVGWRAHELNVKVTTDRPVYRVREKVDVAVQVTRLLDGTPPPKGSEVILAAVDEGLLELAPNDTWKLLSTMMQRRGIEVETATASMQVVGKRHYGRKAREAGGGGGRRAARELFDTLLYWKARVKLDDQGRANVQVPLNDSLTSFRIVAIATAEAGLFGTGQTAIRSSQDLMLFSGLPPLVREQDSFRAGFTVRNAGDVPVHAEVAATYTPEANAKRAAGNALEAIVLELQPGTSQDIAWDVKVPLNVDTLRWEIKAVATRLDGATSGDTMKAVEKVIPAVPVSTYQATLSQLAAPLSLKVAIPSAAIPGRGGVQVSLLKSLAGEMAGVREYMSRYPYTCLEQLLSQAVALRSQAQWDGVMASLPSYLDRDGFAKYFPMLQLGSDVLTTYILSIADESGWEIPEGSRNRMVGALERFTQGQLQREPEWRAADLSIRKIAALQALARFGHKLDDNALASISIEPNLWPTSAVIDWYDLLKRAPDLSKRDEYMTGAEQILRSRLNFQGTTMGFSTERLDYLWWLMISGDVNANRLLLAMLDQPKWREDMPRLVRGSLGRQDRGHWNTTVANAWGVLAIEKFAAAFETTPVTGETRGSLVKQQRKLDWNQQADGGTWMFSWPAQPADLNIEQAGEGKPWTLIQSLAAIPLKDPISSGYKIKRSVVPIEQKTKGQWTRGDVLRIRLDLEAQSDMSWVVVNDPVPGGASILGTGLGRDSQILSSGEKKQGWVWPAYEERKFDSFRAYYRFVPKGSWTVEYTVRLNNAGDFLLPQTRVEALYAPEMFGELPNGVVHVGR